MAISQCYWHLVVKNCNFTLLLISNGQEWQMHIATDIATEISTMRGHISRCNIIFKAHFAHHVFRCSAQLGQIYPPQLVGWIGQDNMWVQIFRSGTQRCVRYTPRTCQMKWPRSDVRWSNHIGYHIYPLPLGTLRWSDQDQIWYKVPT